MSGLDQEAAHTTNSRHSILDRHVLAGCSAVETAFLTYAPLALRSWTHVLFFVNCDSNCDFAIELRGHHGFGRACQLQFVGLVVPIQMRNQIRLSSAQAGCLRFPLLYLGLLLSCSNRPNNV